MMDGFSLGPLFLRWNGLLLALGIAVGALLAAHEAHLPLRHRSANAKPMWRDDVSGTKGLYNNLRDPSLSLRATYLKKDRQPKPDGLSSFILFLTAS